MFAENAVLGEENLIALAISPAYTTLFPFFQ
jgi:hypothetical protein